MARCRPSVMNGDVRRRSTEKADAIAGKVNIIFLACVLAFVAFVLYRLPAQLEDLRPKTQCISNMKQLGTSFHLYAEANDQRLPASAWADAVYPFAKNWDLYSCDKVLEKGQKWGYALNWRVVGLKLTSVPDPAKKVMLFETDALAKGVVANLAAIGTPRHRDRVVVGRLDTSTKTVLPADVPALDH